MCKARILVVDDERGVRTFCTDLLTRAGHQVESVDSGAAALELAAQRDYNIVLADINMPRMDGIELCRRLRAQNPDQVVILITGFPSIDNAVQGMKEGARDYVTKPFTPDELRLVVSRSLDEQRLRDDNERLRRALRSREGLETIVGRAPAMRRLFEVARKVAPSDTTVLIEGESGTGKELFARALHVHSKRATRPFIAINCGSLMSSLLESELFGHVKGAFTGAHANKLGLFAAAEGGTLFLDEIGELALDLQPKLLRALQEGEIKPVGGVTTHRVNVRVIAATNRDLQGAVAEGRFREDLYYRINVFSLKVPPLRDRSEDIRRLVSHFLQCHDQKNNTPPRTISEEALTMLEGRPWPGNVRELQNILERALILGAGEVLQLEDFGEAPPAPPRGAPSDQGQGVPRALVPTYPFEGLTLEEMERQHIEFTLNSVAGQKTRAAELLGINRTTLWKKLRLYDGD